MRFNIYSEPGVTKWGPETTGGSEGYHIELGKRLAAKGHEVWSYANVPDGFPVGSRFKGVYWESAASAKEAPSLDGVWILQRSPSLAYKIKARNPEAIVLFSAHDLDYVEEKGLPPWTWMVDAILAESKIHAKYLQLNHKACPNHVVISGTGFSSDWVSQLDYTQRNPKVIFHPCNPTRGLLQLLTIFYRAYEEDSGLRLRVSYGFDYLDDLIRTVDADGSLARLRKALVKKMNHPGVEYLGRLATIKEVQQEHAKAGMFVYPTMYSEIACCNLMEAQAFGSIPIVSPTMALAEHTLHGVKIQGDVETDRLVQARFVREIVALANRPELQEKIRVPMMKEARERFDFSGVVDRIECLAFDLTAKRRQALAAEEVGA